MVGDDIPANCDHIPPQTMNDEGSSCMPASLVASNQWHGLMVDSLVC